MTQTEKEDLLKALNDFSKALIKFRAALPRILKERLEAEKNKPPRDPMADAW